MAFKYALVALGIVCTSACSTAAPDITRPHQQTAVATEKPRYNTVNIIDDALQTTQERRNGSTHISTKLVVEGYGSTPTATGGREVWAVLRNLTDFQQNLEARVTWYDENERPVDGPSAWTRIFVTANGAETFRSLSVTPGATAFYVEIRELKQ